MHIYGFYKSTPILYPLWFLRDLYVLNILAIVFKKFVNSFPKISLITFLLMWIFVKDTHIFFLNVEAICFWGIGCYIVLNKIDLKNFDKINKLVICALYVLSIIANVISQNAVYNLYINRIMVLIGIIFCYVIMTNIKNVKLKNVLIYLSTYSFSIYLFHEMSLSIVRKLLTKLLPMTFIFQLVEYLGIPILIFCECLIISIFLEKKFPRLYLIVTGNRAKSKNTI